MPQRWTPRVTVAAIIEREGRYMLVEEHTPEGLRLNNPAGHLEPGESIVQGVEREALEETAHAFTAEALVGVYLNRFSRTAVSTDLTYMRFAFCGRLGERQPGRRLDHGIVRTLWLTVDEVRESRARHRSPLVWRCVQDHAAGVRHPLDTLVADPSVFGESPPAPAAR